LIQTKSCFDDIVYLQYGLKIKCEIKKALHLYEKPKTMKAMKTQITFTKGKTWKLKQVIFFMSFTMISVLLNAQSMGEIHGRVLDMGTGTSLPGTNVVIKVNNTIVAGATTDADGYFRLKPVPVGTHIVTVSYVGYGSQELVNVVVDADKITNLRNIELSFGENIGTVIIICKKDLVDADDPSKKTMDMKIVQKIPGSSNMISLLSAISSDIYVSEDQKQIHFRGSRANDAIYIVDGVKTMGPGSMIPTRGIGNMTVYSGGVPAKYGDFTGGVIIIESEGYFSWLNKERSKELMNQ